MAKTRSQNVAAGCPRHSNGHSHDGHHRPCPSPHALGCRGGSWLGFTRPEALSLGKALAGLNAQSKGRRLGIFKPQEEKPGAARKRPHAEIGCYRSHLKAIDAFLRTDHTHALILEDDAVFAASLTDAIQEFLRYADLWDVLRLSTVNTDRAVPVIRLPAVGASLGVNVFRSKGAAAYMLNRRAAQTFLRRLVPMRLAYDIAFDLEYLWGLRAMAVTPCPVVADAKASTQIQIAINSYKYGWTRYLTVFPFRMVVESIRIACRSAFLARLLVCSALMPHCVAASANEVGA